MGDLPAGVGPVLALLVALTLGAVLLAGEGSDDGKPINAEARVLVDPVPYDGRSPREPAGDKVRILVALQRPALGELRDPGSASQQRRYVASLRREGEALRGALEAQGLELEDPVSFERVWNGFAATVDSKQVVELARAGLATRLVRRFFPAVSEPSILPEAASPTRVALGPQAPIALLAAGVEPQGIEDNLAGGYDAVQRDTDPSPAVDPRDPSRSEASGDLLARRLADLGARVWPIRVAALRPSGGGLEEFARTDELLAGLERVVDPDADGDIEDLITLAVVGVNAPFAGFKDAPESEAVRAARGLGSRIIAPAGHEGPGSAASGTIGSPAAAEEAIAVAPGTSAGQATGVELEIAGTEVLTAPLGRPVGAGRLKVARVPDGATAADLLRPGAPVLAGRLAVVRAGPDPGAQATAAAAAGAGAVLLADPRPARRMPALPAGRVRSPVFAITGEPAEAILASEDGSDARIGRTVALEDGQGPREVLSPFASRGPGPTGEAKPDRLAFGVARVRTPSGTWLVGGAGIAAVDVAAAIAQGRRVAPAPRPPVSWHAPRVPVGRPVVDGDDVRFSVGRFERGDPATGGGTLVIPAARLDLTLEAGATRRRLTPPGGERGLLPGEYAYALPRDVAEQLPAGAYRYVIRARAPGQRRDTVVRSGPISLP